MHHFLFFLEKRTTKRLVKRTTKRLEKKLQKPNGMGCGATWVSLLD
jgi:hypothetical protein